MKIMQAWWVWLAAAVISVLAPIASAQISLRNDPAMVVAPAAAAPGLAVSVRADYLDIRRDHRVVLFDGRNGQTLLTQRPTASSHTFRVQVPTIAAGDYEILLMEVSAIIGGSDEEIGREPFEVLAPLSMSVGTATPQAGKYLTWSVSRLAGGSLRLNYGGRIIYGPVPVRGSSASGKVLLPADFPTSLPATVALRAENLIGSQLVNRASRSLTVAKAYTGPKIAITGLTSSTTSPRPGMPFTITGKLDAFDDVTRGDVRTSFSWVGEDGRIVPLSGDQVSMDANGNFSMSTRFDDRGLMSAGRPSGRGRVVAHSAYASGDRPVRENQYATVIADYLDTDAQADITLRVRGIPADGGAPVPLEGALVVATASEIFDFALDLPDPPPLPGNGVVSMNDLLRFGKENQYMQALDIDYVEHQALQLFTGCPVTPLRRETDASGIVSYNLNDPTGNAPGSGDISAGDPAHGGFAAGGCRVCDFDEDGLPRGQCCSFGTDYIDTEIQIRAMHLGYGRFDPETGTERPFILRVNYNEDTGRINVHGPGPNDLRSFERSANITIDLPDAAAYTNRVLISDPWIDGVPRHVQAEWDGRRTLRFGNFIDYGYVSGDVVLDFPHDDLFSRKLRFFHEPDADGALTRAELYYYPSVGAAPVKLGNFVRSNTLPVCAFVPGAAHEYEFQFNDTHLLGWRYPQLLTGDGEHPSFLAYEIRVATLGRDGHRTFFVGFQPAPDEWGSFNELLVDDRNLNEVKIVSNGDLVGASDTHAPNPGYGVGARDNNKVTSRGLYQIVTPTGVGAAQSSLVNAAEQFSRVPEEDLAIDLDRNSLQTISFGDDVHRTLIDESFPVFYWAWGVPEIFAIQLSVDIGLRATYLMQGQLGANGLKLRSENDFAILLTPTADIDVLFGLLFDAGASLPMTFLSTMPVVVENGDLLEAESQPCFTFNMSFSAFFDPCNLCPWDTAYEFEETLLEDSDCPGNQLLGLGKNMSPGQQLFAAAGPDFAKAKASPEALRATQRHPAIAFDRFGNGHLFALDATKRLVATKLSGGIPGTTSMVLSSAPNIRHPVIAYYASNRAIAAWVESAANDTILAGQDLSGKTRNQRVVWAHWDGRAWSAKRALTSAGQGQGHLAIAACVGGDVGCPTPGEVILVWQTNTSGNVSAPAMRLQYARYAPNSDVGAFGAPATLGGPTPPAAYQDITPTVDYVRGIPVAAWVRYLAGSMEDTQSRTLVWRYIGGPNHAGQLGSFVRRVAQPSIKAIDDGFKVAFTVADSVQGFAGNHQALYTTTVLCPSGSPCVTKVPIRQKDEHGRAIYVERPKLVLDEAGTPTVVARLQRFGMAADGTLSRPQDPPGAAIGSGDIVQLRSINESSRTRVSLLTADGDGHMQLAAARNPATNEIAAVGVRAVDPAFRRVASKYVELYPQSGRALGKTLLVDEGLSLSSMPAVIDPAIESITSATRTLEGGTQVTIEVEVANRGAGFDPDRDGSVNLELRFDAPTAASAPDKIIAVPAIEGGDSHPAQVVLDVPADFHDDEPHTLYARLVPESSSWNELDGDNNAARIDFGALPVPHALRSEVQPGVSAALLTFDADADARVVGYRVYAQDDVGARFALGSTATRAFLDPTAGLGQTRRYVVVSYSARGVESEPSAEIAVTPRAASVVPSDVLFGDGFETL